MVRPSRPSLTVAAVTALVVLAGIAGRDALQLRELQAANARIAQGRAQATPAARPEEVFAAAARAAQEEDMQRALHLYDRLDHGTGPVLAARARYNMGNLYLRQALRFLDDGDAASAIPMLELAKESYRTVLRIDPQHWDARYNLERALRHAPEEEAEDLAGDAPPGERSVTTLQAQSQGLP